MAEKQVKQMKGTITNITDSGRSTKGGSKIYNISFRPEGSEFDIRAATFSSTIAAEAEKVKGQVADLEVEIGEYQGNPSYAVNGINGVKNSGFKKGGNYAKDVVSLERRVAAQVAAELLGIVGLGGKKTVSKEFEKIADDVYVWISKRPSEPAASGGETKQKTEDDVIIEDIPPEFQ